MSTRVFLRSFNKSDAPTIFKWGQDDYYQRLGGFQHYENLTQAEAAVNQYTARKYSYAVCLHKNQQLVGLVELYERGTNEQDLLKTKEVGFLLDKNFSGHGLMTEALTLLFTYAFGQLKQKVLWAGTFKDNLRSQKLLQRLGFHYVYAVDLGQISDIFTYEEKYYLLKKADWLKGQSKENLKY
ncbi:MULTISPECIES: GNAT family N-acetyltransferase [unclassified Lactobacillus]|uniref:GNAT family N-acetyltransferase n=1 Tax=unclassified Lactobacillus TaxID=2620435 RepID=UPI000EFA938E|nr:MULTISPECIES: GNAT family N-acetyltransferase [unclassified Lactobacillus]RMC25815.1 N-acetyltransferase [Lactobacillus sp. ESL0247]RMC29627.1 N-acetyltransferase [Lactobacillus sp. ESL0246]RMC33616.1 N-acetyltransferase [Lactobacillus sp. ESL0245]